LSHCPKPAVEQEGNFRGRHGHEHINDEGKSCDTREQPEENQRATDDFAVPHKEGHDGGGRNTNLEEGPDPQRLRKEKLLHTFEEKHPSHDEPDEGTAADASVEVSRCSGIPESSLPKTLQLWR
jgi:hypothetical protein